MVNFNFSGDDEDLAVMLDKMVRANLRIVTCREVPLTLEEAYMTVSGFEGELAGRKIKSKSKRLDLKTKR